LLLHGLTCFEIKTDNRREQSHCTTARPETDEVLNFLMTANRYEFQRKLLIILTGGLLTIGSAVILHKEFLDAPSVLAEQSFTVIEKTNTLWPLKGESSTDPCRYRQCFHI
jgi:hypothetical protein